MTYQATVYTLMISCPSDACKEQQEVKKQIIGWNEVYSEKDSRVLLPAFYKTHVPPMLASAEDPRAQAAINKHMIPDADWLIVIFKNKIGTRTGKHKSGTTEEIELFMKMHPERPVSVYLYGGCNDKRISVYKKQLNSKGVFWGVYRNRNHLGHELSRNLSQTIHSNQYLRHKYINIEAIIESRANILLSAMRNNAEQHLIAKRTENELIIYIGRHMFFACDMALDRLFRSRHIDQINDEEYKLTDWGKQQIDDPKKPIMPLI